MYKFAINRPIATLMFFALLIVFGIFSIKNMSINAYPQVDIPLVKVTTYTNGDMSLVKNSITKRLEDELNSISGVKHITSHSFDNLSMIFIEFYLNKDIEIALNDVRDRIAKAKVGSQSVAEKMGAASEEIFGIFISAKDDNQTALMHAIEHKARSFLQRIKGVAEVGDVGFLKPEISVLLDAEKLDKYSLNASNIASIIKTQNLKMPLGKVENDNSKITLKSAFDAKSIDEIAQIRLLDGVFLKDVAKVEFGGSERVSYASFIDKNGAKNGVVLQIKKISGADTLQIISEIKSKTNELSTLLGENFDIKTIYDKSILIEQYTNQAIFDMVLGVLLTALIVFLFLRNFSGALIATIAIPTSIVATFFIIHLLGNDINRLTLIALTIGIGIFVDDAIVVIENIIKHIQNGEKDPLKASYLGVKEIAFSVLAISVVLLCVFVPIAFMNSIVGRFFNAFALSVAGGIVISFLVCIMLTPTLCARFLNANESKFYKKSEKFFVAMEEWYEKFLRFALRFKALFIVLTLVVFAFSLLLASTLGSGFKPSEDNSEFHLMIKADPSVSAKKMMEKSAEILTAIKANENVEYAYMMLGYTDAKEIYKAKIYVRLHELSEREKRQDEVIKDLKDGLKFDGFKIWAVELPMVETGGDMEEIQLIITADKEQILEPLVPKVREILQQIGGLVDISSPNEDKKEQVEIFIDRQKAKVLGISEYEIADVIYSSFSSNSVGVFDDGANEYAIMIRFDDAFRQDIEALKKLRINLKGSEILLGDVASFVKSKALSSLPRYDKQDELKFLANTNGAVLSDIKAKIDEALAPLLPDQSSLKYAGFIDYMQDTNKAFIFTIMMSAVLIYMVLAALYESFILPFIIMLSMPLAFGGVAVGLYLSGNSFSLFVMVGAILLFGMVGKNAILLVDFANKFAKDGENVDEAVIKAGKARLRAILMTTLAMIFAMLPLALSRGAGYEGNSPMAIAIICGLISSTILSLIVVPTLFGIIYKIDSWFRKIYEKRPLDG
ncbi:efflux RND transporter permease subunit [Campylobacter suis]|uniref:Multidrug resistance protein MdtC n=1 Tax=Campylobacter suis TaxID=2790657 RepID=A0ABM8Q1V3_9BACT|nr:efflux RND transporter permease subunit [Campylobacter suis]CAD7286785.1 Multidrug resistance protein MdtC [Campylobacter suis]